MTRDGASPELSGGDHKGDRVRSGRVRRSVAPVRMAARTAAARAALAARTVGKDADAKERHRREFHERMAERYVAELGDMKGALMKFGQLASFVDAGVIPERYRDVYQRAFSRLLADAPSMPLEVLDAVVEDELGAPAKEIFAWFSPEPLASASIGQVHEARLDDGTAVVVKIQYPGVADAIDNDLSNAELLSTFMRMGQSMLGGLAPKVDAKLLVSELRERISEELDYTIELRNQQLFGALYNGHPFIRVPKTFEEYSARRVFTMSYADGLRWEEALEAPQSLRDRWGEVLYRFAFSSLDRYAMFNADPHPGNYIFHTDGTVSFLDFGCVKFMPPEQMRGNITLIRAVADGRAEEFKAGLVRGGYLPHDSDLDADRLLEWYAGALYHLHGTRARYRFTHEDVAEFIKRIYDPRGEYGDIVRSFTAPKDFTLVTRIDLGLWSILAMLGAENYWRDIADELWGVGPPATELGLLDAHWVEKMRERPDWPPAPPQRPERFTSPITSMAFDPQGSDFRTDPYVDYERLRVQGPVHWVPPGMYLVPRYEDCFALLRDPRLSSDPTRSQLYESMVRSVWGVDSAVDRLTRRMLLFMDPPDHERLRSLAASAFTRRSVEDLRPQIQQIVDVLLDAAIASGGTDIVADFAYPLPIRVIASLLGVPMSDRERFTAWSRDLVDITSMDQPSDDDVRRIDTTITDFLDYFRTLAEQRRREPRDDLLTELVRAESAGDRLTTDELLATCVLLLVAGHETTANLIGNAVIALLKTDGAWLRLVREPDLAPKAVEELLRYDSPVQATARTTLENIEVGGKPIPAGERVVLLLGSANRDPVAFVSPDTLVLDRDAGRHLAFGAGVHFCLGAPLARLEAQVALRTLTARFPSLRLRSDDVEWKDTFPIRGPRSLPVTW